MLNLAPANSAQRNNEIPAGTGNPKECESPGNWANSRSAKPDMVAVSKRGAARYNFADSKEKATLRRAVNLHILDSWLISRWITQMSVFLRIFDFSAIVHLKWRDLSGSSRGPSSSPQCLKNSKRAECDLRPIRSLCRLICIFFRLHE